jgi:methionyl aminopeptidase
LDAEGLEGMRKVCKLGREVLDLIGRAVKPGITTDDLDKVCHDACIERNCYPSPLNYRGFPKSVCTSVNEVICHGIPDSRVLEDGDIVNIDVTVYFGGYHGDLNETFYVGTPDEKTRKLVIGAYACLQDAIAQVKPGTLYRNVGNHIEKQAHSRGLNVVRTYCGHGIHKLFHTNPTIPHYAKNKAPGVMQVGHVFTIEPMINTGRWEDTLWPDNWTAVTQDGSRSAQFEETMVVTENGVEILTARPEGELPQFMRLEKEWGGDLL